MKQIFLILYFLPVLTVFSGCQLPEDRRSLIIGDFSPPQYISGEMTGPGEAYLLFDKPASAEQGDIHIHGNHQITKITQVSNSLVLKVEPHIAPGEKRLLQGSFRDDSRNSLHITVPLFGFNPNPAEVMINEFTSRGSAAHPDRVELLVTRGGSTAGIAFYDGIRLDYRQMKILPDVEVEKGDFIIIHCRPDDPLLKDETEDKASASGTGTHEEAWDFFIHDGTGLSGNNGVLSIYASPAGGLMTGVFYSDRTSDSDERYRGFGSTVMLQRVEYLCREGVWDADEKTVSPEDGISSTFSTATRSMSRVQGRDTRSRADWITVPTRGATFGYENREDSYMPSP